MKSIIVSLSILFASVAQAQLIEPGEAEQHEHVLTPEEEKEFYETYFSKDSDLFIQRFRFPQTHWLECTDEITGNYYGYNCASRRGISAILYSFMNNYIYQCIDAGLAAQGGGQVAELHIVHAGILGDRNHSPRSLHAENRAIDIKAFDMKLTSGAVKKFTFADSNHRPFFRAFRDCWGRVVNAHNGCPFYAGDPSRTGSIGWEDRNHQTHMHTSVPYCVNGRYGSGYYQR